MGCLVSRLAFMPPPRHAGASRKLLGWPAAVALGAGAAVGLMIGNAAGVLDGPVFRGVLRQGALSP